MPRTVAIWFHMFLNYLLFSDVILVHQFCSYLLFLSYFPTNNSLAGLFVEGKTALGFFYFRYCGTPVLTSVYLNKVRYLQCKTNRSAVVDALLVKGMRRFDRCCRSEPRIAVSCFVSFLVFLYLFFCISWSFIPFVQTPSC